jgi:hypothetical protein
MNITSVASVRAFFTDHEKSAMVVRHRALICFAKY